MQKVAERRSQFFPPPFIPLFALVLTATQANLITSVFLSVQLKCMLSILQFSDSGKWLNSTKM